MLSPIGKLLGVAIPVFVSSAFCLSVPFILLIADTAVLTATLLVFFSERRKARTALAVPASRTIAETV